MDFRSRSQIRVLLVDDDGVSLQVHAAALEDAGYVVETRVNAFGTLPHVLRFRPHLVVLDLNMPGLDGGELADLIQGRAGATSSNVVFLSGVTQAELDRTIAERGALGGIRKGTDLREFVAQFDGFAAKTSLA